ncbi:MAG: MFS transporter [Clostridia bacterium]|nr:MFS transporter [Clostridia bacterium]NCD03053.1 MFS transporter [Clostridia bacterium]
MKKIKTVTSPTFQIFAIAATACLLYAVSAGLRSNYGLLIEAILKNNNINYSSVSFILAAGQLVFGITQPVFGVIALKKTNRFVLITGLMLMITGSLLTPLSKSGVLLFLSLGIILPAGTGAISFGVIMGTVTPRLGRQKAATISGIVSASSGIGSTVLSPIIQNTLAQSGLMGTMFILSLPMLLLVPLSLYIAHGEQDSAQNGNTIPIFQMIQEAFQNPSYRFISIGFFTCGFHMAIIETHVYSQFISYGISNQLAALAFSIYGLATMFGCIISGIVSAKLKMKWVLSFLYGFRALFIMAFLFLPKTLITVFAFAILLGLSSAATVTPTSGITEKMFGAARLATLFGICFFMHQIGSFFSAWFGGICVEKTGSYTMIWIADIALCFFASVICTRIDERRN